MTIAKGDLMKQCKLFFYLLTCLVGLNGIASVSADVVIVLSSESPFRVLSDNAKIYGSSHDNHVIIEPGTKAQLIHFPGNNYSGSMQTPICSPSPARVRWSFLTGQTEPSPQNCLCSLIREFNCRSNNISISYP